MDDSVTIPEKWTPPAELTRERPRPVRLSASGIVLKVLSAIMIVGALPTAVVMVMADRRADARTEALRSQGRDIVAEVTRVRRTGKDKQPRVSYRFVVDDARYETDVKAPLAVWSDLHVGSPLTVRFLPNEPSVNHPTAWGPSRMGLFPPIFTGGFLVAIGGLLWFIMRRERRLLEDGVPAPGVVTRSHRTKGGYAAHYQFRGEDGEIRSSRGVVSRRYQPGEPLCVVVDPDNPRRSAPYPMKLFRVRET